MDLSTFLILVIFFILILSISMMIEDMKYRLAFYMVCALGFLTLLNIYLGISYYISLRNDAGVQGPQGDKGPQGVQGPPGNCSYSSSCSIPDARNLILTAANKLYGINTQCLDTPSLSNCNNNQAILDQARPINSTIGMLEQIAYQTTMSRTDFQNKLNVCLQDPDNCTEDVNF
jgi:hypothetical protein